MEIPALLAEEMALMLLLQFCWEVCLADAHRDARAEVSEVARLEAEASEASAEALSVVEVLAEVGKPTRKVV